ncbi:MAG: cyclase family protein [Rhodospirillales bacterium]|jgi:kynurenine formamidase|nr:cyclase [Rhodospirillaceae bacterium]MAF49171.1 cyclase [Rhodospirillaceae bacterium]MDP6429048.1 cyclase family protein [Rhodospirillales bacterium]MDP6644250.1 cyclase family protein [Rhodospirillales bacterium]MDP6843634.1 cyclase family protein [Rhodospirillales bacterium]|tara:strand:- start:1100 stop:1942 length:843 start_codon:yes stop_codon:yes gene_type:complete
MKMVDLSHMMNVHTPGWVGYAGNKMYYAQNLQTGSIVAQRIDTAMHAGTHIDGAMHATDEQGDMGSYALDYLVGAGAVVDISGAVGDWDTITPAMLEAAPVDIEDGDILIIHTGYHRYYEGQAQQDLVRYFCMHPGGKMELLEWMFDKKIKWFGIDVGSGDHPMNTSIRHMRPDLARQFAEKVGMPAEEFFGEYEYTHKLSGRAVKSDIFPFHSYAFQEGLIHAENVGGDIESVLNQRCIVGAFPWRYDGLESCPCRIICFFDVGDGVEAVGNVAKAITG